MFSLVWNFKLTDKESVRVQCLNMKINSTLKYKYIYIVLWSISTYSTLKYKYI